MPISRSTVRAPFSCLLSTISYHELFYGALRSVAVQRYLHVVAEFIAPLTVLPFTLASADHSSQVREKLAVADQTIGPLDTLIGGHALEHQLALVTGNTREFSRVNGLRLENWS